MLKSMGFPSEKNSYISYVKFDYIEEMRYNKVMVNLPSPTFVGTIDAK